MSCARRTRRGVKWSKCATSCAKIAAVSSGVEKLEQRIAHRHRWPADRRQRHRVHEPRSFGSHAIDRRHDRARSSHDLLEPRRELRARERLTRVCPEPDARIPRFPREEQRGQRSPPSATMSQGRSVPTRPTTSARCSARSTSGDPEAETADDGGRGVPEIRAESPRFAEHARTQRIRDRDQEDDEEGNAPRRRRRRRTRS